MTLQDQPLAFPLPLATLFRPAPELEDRRDQQPVAPVRFPDGSTGYVALGYDEVRRVLVDPRFSRAAAAAAEAQQGGLAVIADDSILGMDPPEHSRLRRLVAGAFTARRVEAMRPRVQALVGELLDDLVRTGPPADLVAAFSLPLPVRVICELLGVRPGDQHLFHGWSDTVMGSLDRDPAEARAAAAELSGYFAGLIAEKRARPADDLITALIAARDEQDRLSEHELVVLCFGLLIAGHETTANQLSMFVVTLLHFPEVLERVRADPSSLPHAVEELLRFVQLGDSGTTLPRVTTEDVELGGVTIPAGSVVLPALGVANRDPGHFDGAARFDLDRLEIPHLSFGAGAHHCLGAQLARLELQEALRGVLTRVPGLRLAVPESELRFKPGMIVRSLEQLPVTW